MENNAYELYMTGKQAVKHVTELKRNPELEKVYICYHANITHVVRTEVSDSGCPRDDTYSDSGYTVPSVSLELTWKQFLKFCEEADSFSKAKQERFEDIGADTTTSEHGTGIKIYTSISEHYPHAMVWVG